MTDTEEVFRKYLDFLEQADEENIGEILNYVDKEVRFKDPLHDAQGASEIHRIFKRLLTDLKKINFTTRELIATGDNAYYKWTLECYAGRKSWSIKGVTFLTIGERKLITNHIEYWDTSSQIYEKLPIIGPQLRLLRRILIH